MATISLCRNEGAENDEKAHNELQAELEAASEPYADVLQQKAYLIGKPFARQVWSMLFN